ncbi:Vesicle-associated membrane-protein-associated protein [Phytophthora cactorum]|nr:Vesicle-associated membrane-protein-associated protein [Phytophthora cactorum]
MITASVGVGSCLLLEPARELLFPVPDATSAQRPRCNLNLTNLSPLNDVVFRVRTRNPDAFTVRPTHGLVAPGASVQVTITATARTCERLSAMDPRDLMTRQSSELFVVQSVEREEEVQAMEPLDPNSNTSLRAFWKKVPKDSITENKMVCRFTGASGFPAAEVAQDWNMFSRTPMLMDRRMSASKNYATPTESQAINRRSEAKTAGSTNATLSRPPMTRQRDTVLTSISVSDSSVSDTMLTALSTDTAPSEPTHEIGPLLYHIQPSDMLSFNVKPAPRFWGSTSLYIVNSSQNDCLTFKVRTSNQSGYVVKPSRGLVSTTSAQEVVVSLCAPRDENNFDPEKRESKDGFMIEVANISRDNTPICAVGDRLNSIYPYSDSDESAFTIAPTAVPTEVGDDDNNDDSTYSSASKTPQDSAVIVVSADRMDTVDFSNPKLSFFI